MLDRPRPPDRSTPSAPFTWRPWQYPIPPYPPDLVALMLKGIDQLHALEALAGHELVSDSWADNAAEAHADARHLALQLSEWTS